MSYIEGAGEAILASREQAAGGQQAADGTGGVALILVTIVVVAGLSLCCRSKPPQHSRSQRSGADDRHPGPPS